MKVFIFNHTSAVGYNSNYAIVAAQLYTKGQCYGVHQFLVPIRNSETWKPLNGIEVGAIGASMGVHSFNNGYLKMNNVRVPRTNMLMKLSEVLPNGNYIKRENPILTYFTMMFVRTTILKQASLYMAKIATIAIRYSAVRRQSPINFKQSSQEVQIIDYVTQQYKLFPNLAASLVFKIMFEYVWEIFNRVRLELSNNNYKRLPEVLYLTANILNKSICLYFKKFKFFSCMQ